MPPSPPGTDPHHGPAAPSRSVAPFMTLWTGQALSLFGSQAVQFAMIWWLTVETGSATVLATAAFVGLVPQVLLGPFIGTLVDRWSRRAIMFASDSVVALASLILAAMFHSGRGGIAAVFVVLFVRALGSAFHGPAMLASTTLMVPERHFTRIQGMNQALQGGLAIIGAPAGALLYGALPMAGVMLVDVVTALFALGPLMFIHVPGSGAPADGRPGILGQTMEGFRFLKSRRGHLVLVLMAAAINLCLVPAFALLPLLVQDALGGDALTLGWMTSLFGAGMLAGGVVLGAWGGFRRRITTSLTGIAGLGLAVLALGASPQEPRAFAPAALLVVGLMVPICNGPIHAIFQATVPPHYQGRVFTLLGTLSASMAPLGLTLAAPVAGLAGVRGWFILGGIVTFGMGILGFFLADLTGIEETRSDEISGPLAQDADIM